MTFLGMVHYSRDCDWDMPTPIVGLFVTIGLQSTCNVRSCTRINDNSKPGTPALEILTVQD